MSSAQNILCDVISAVCVCVCCVCCGECVCVCVFVFGRDQNGLLEMFFATICFLVTVSEHTLFLLRTRVVNIPKRRSAALQIT